MQIFLTISRMIREIYIGLYPRWRLKKKRKKKGGVGKRNEHNSTIIFFLFAFNSKVDEYCQ